MPPSPDCCPPGWLLYHGKCLFVSSEKKSWRLSQDDCEGRASQLLLHDERQGWALPVRGGCAGEGVSPLPTAPSPVPVLLQHGPGTAKRGAGPDGLSPAAFPARGQHQVLGEAEDQKCCEDGGGLWVGEWGKLPLCTSPCWGLMLGQGLLWPAWGWQRAGDTVAHATLSLSHAPFLLGTRGFGNAH